MSKIAIIEYHNLLRRGLADLLSQSPEVHVTAVVESPAAFEREAVHCDVLVFGPSPVAERSLAETLGPLAARGRVLLIADFPAGRSVAEALRAGAYGVVMRQADDEEVLCAITAVARGGLYLSPCLASRMLSELRQSTASSLAPRETEALRWLAAGFTHGQIARRMDLTEATVSTYVKRIKIKLNVGNKADLTRKAIELGLLRENAAEPESSRRG
jgi:DNA-binding NarL/FixJ family response regulator